MKKYPNTRPDISDEAIKKLLEIPIEELPPRYFRESYPHLKLTTDVKIEYRSFPNPPPKRILEEFEYYGCPQEIKWYEPKPLSEAERAQLSMVIDTFNKRPANQDFEKLITKMLSRLKTAKPDPEITKFLGEPEVRYDKFYYFSDDKPAKHEDDTNA